jgi:hypothetical protein
MDGGGSDNGLWTYGYRISIDNDIAGTIVHCALRVDIAHCALLILLM